MKIPKCQGGKLLYCQRLSSTERYLKRCEKWWREGRGTTLVFLGILPVTSHKGWIATNGIIRYHSSNHLVRLSNLTCSSSSKFFCESSCYKKKSYQLATCSKRKKSRIWTMWCPFIGSHAVFMTIVCVLLELLTCCNLCMNGVICM